MAITEIKQIRALVTGANRGIGRAYTEYLLEHGAERVYAGARNTESLGDLAAKYPGRLVPVELDVTKLDHIHAAAKHANDINLLLNNAGALSTDRAIQPDGSFDLEGARWEMEVNYFGLINVTRAFAGQLVKAGGAIINLASIASWINFPTLATYSASKAAVHSVTQAIRAELSHKGVHVLGVYPGPIDTDMAKSIEMDKESPTVVAEKTFNALLAGDEELFPDATAVQMKQRIETEPKVIEREVATMAHGEVSAA